MLKVADQTTNQCFFYKKNWTCLIFFVSRLEAYLLSQTNRSDRPNMSNSTNLSVTSRWLQYNEETTNISLPTKQICHTDQLFSLSSTSRPFYASRWRDLSACRIHTLCSDIFINPINVIDYFCYNSRHLIPIWHQICSGDYFAAFLPFQRTKSQIFHYFSMPVANKNSFKSLKMILKTIASAIQYLDISFQDYFAFKIITDQTTHAIAPG